ncbi:MAG: PEPxxWA-CTERM sorting domain-containing protein [Sulfuritalea sp.]|nr:PEPxxWA-CTERM sorting domain-containing protein [Sulfuritalea sp.]
MNPKLRTMFASLALIFAGSSHADTLITFEEAATGLTAMVNSFTLVPTGSRLSNQYLSSNGVSFSSLAGYVALVNHAYPTASFPNIIGGTAANGQLSYNAPITISFFDTANTSVKAVTSSFKIQGDWYPLGWGSVFATAYGVAGNVLGSTSDTDNKVYGVSGPVLEFNNIAGIHSVVISGDNGTVGFDNLQYGVLTAVPEPGTYALMLAGLGLVGALARRRKASQQ